MTLSPDAPWYRQVTGQQWKTFLTTFTAWTLDSFDFTILTFVLIDIQQSFSVNRALACLAMLTRSVLDTRMRLIVEIVEDGRM